MSQTYYTLLGLGPNASAAAIKSAYKKIAMQKHPDRGGDAEAFKELSTAYATLSDERLRDEYDRSLLRPMYRPSIRCLVDVTLDDLISGKPKTLAMRFGDRMVTADVTLTPDMESGTKIIVSTDSRVDIIASLRVHDPKFQKRGLDLFVRASAPLWDFLVGGEITVDNPYKIQYNVKIPAGTVPGATLKLRGCGLSHNGRRGDLSVTLESIYPKSLSHELSDAILTEQSLLKGQQHATQSRD